MKGISFLVSASALALIASPALAQSAATSGDASESASGSDSGLEEIVVTAQKRAQGIETVPVAVSAFSAAALERKGVSQFTDLPAIAPSLTITQNTNSTSGTAILRGIGTSAVSISIEPSVAVVVDDVALLQQAQAFSGLNDISRIEVLRGPQGTLFGKGASAGVINIVTAAPTTDLSGQVRATATSDDEYRIEGSLAGPLGANAGFRLNSFFSDRDGYVTNLVDGTKLGAEQSYGLGAKLQFNPSNDLEIALSGRYVHSSGNETPRTYLAVPTGTTVYGLALAPNLVGIQPGVGNFLSRQDTIPATESDSWLLSGRLRYSLGPVDLVSITSYQDWAYKFSEDLDYTNLPVNGNPTGYVQVSPFKAHQFSQEVRLVSTAKGPVQYLLGFYYADGRSGRTFDRGPNGSVLASWSANTGTETVAVFGQGSVDFSSRFHLDAGLRYNKESIDVDFLNRLAAPAVPPANNGTCLALCTGAASDDAVTGKVALRYDIADRTMVYASFATGHKGQAYDISTGFTPTRAASPVLPERSRSYEIGLKSRFFDNRVQFNLAAFSTDYDDFQAQSTIVQPDLSTVFKLNNVGSLRTRGVELELHAKPSESFEFELSGMYLDAKIQRFPNANCYPGQTSATGCVDIDGAGPLTNLVQNLAGKRLANAPEFKFNVGGTYSFSVPGLSQRGFVTMGYNWQSEVNFDLAQNPLTKQPAYGLFNLSFGIRPEDNHGLQVTVFVNNLFDKHYSANIGTAAGSSFGALSQIVSRDSHRYGGIRVGYSF